MPYITQQLRDCFDDVIDEIADEFEKLPQAGRVGVINYIITRIITAHAGEGSNYETYNACIGILESCKLEMYRRLVAVYEDRKIQENGDVYK